MAEQVWEVPDGWHWSTLGEVCQVNVRNSALRDMPNDLPVSFVPMAAVDAGLGSITTPQVRLLGEVRKGFTPFADGDVIFARITPSMENGKAAIAHGLENGLGFGSTEFHVLKPQAGILPEWLFHFIRRQAFRNEAKANFSGTAGQLRVPDHFVRESPIPIAPIADQQRIVGRIGGLFAESLTARETLERVPALLKRFRQAVLAAAFSGKLTERDPNDEPAAVLLERINGKLRANEKATKRQRHTEADGLVTDKLPKLPQGWAWTRFDDLLTELKNGYFAKTPDHQPPGIPILRISAVRPRSVILDEPRYLRGEDESRVGQYHLRNGDLLFTRYNGSLELVGVCGMVRNLNSTVIYPDKLIRARVVEQYIEPSYLELYFSTRVPRQIVETKAKSSAGQQGISGKDLKAVPIAIAPLGEQRRIVAKVQSLLERADAIELAVEVARRRAEKVDQAILARAFRGEL